MAKRKLTKGEIIGLTNLALKESYGSNKNAIKLKEVNKPCIDDTSEELTLLEALEHIKHSFEKLGICGIPTKYQIECLDIIETALKNYQELLERPCVLVGRTHGSTQALIDKICKNYKEIKITNLEDEMKLKALEIIKEKRVDVELLMKTQNAKEYNMFSKNVNQSHNLGQRQYDLLKEVLL